MNRGFVRHLGLISLGLMMVLSACGIDKTVKEDGSKPVDSGSDQAAPALVDQLDADERAAVLKQLDPQLVKAENDFGLRLHRQLITIKEGGENVIFSPYSISTALALAYNGSAGETALEMEKVLGWTGLDRTQVNEGNQQLKLLLERGSGVILNVANSAWVHQDFTLKDSYLDQIRESYDAEIHTADLKSDAFVKDINDWVALKTKGMIRELYNKPLGEDDKAVLVNAIYFNGGWKDKFNAENTKEEAFTLDDGSVQKVPMMRIEQRFGYKETDSWQSIRIPYGDGRVNMLVILPGESSSLEELHRQLWKEPEIWKGSYETAEVNLRLPRFKAEAEAELADTLQRLGLKLPFDENHADFSDMAEVSVFISKISHKAVVDVNEEGTEAAAVTGVVMTAESAPEMVNMTVNRPFFFAIEDRDTGAWLFMGSVYKP